MAAGKRAKAICELAAELRSTFKWTTFLGSDFICSVMVITISENLRS
jgi:hypothetical protein